MLEALRLEAAAWALRRQADQIEAAARRLRDRIDQSVDGGRWKGPSATQARQAAQDRYGRLHQAAGDMHALATRFLAIARQLREEEQRRAAAAAAAAHG